MRVFGDESLSTSRSLLERRVQVEQKFCSNSAHRPLFFARDSEFDAMLSRVERSRNAGSIKSLPSPTKC